MIVEQQVARHFRLKFLSESPKQAAKTMSRSPIIEW
jgi:hypothetical protein